jgi:hypothetical protein
MGFKHRKITPEHPQANGMGERFMASIGKVVKGAVEKGEDWRAALNAFLRNYRATPHRTTGVSPNQLLFNVCRTSRLPNVFDEAKPARQNELLHQLAKLKDAANKDKAKVYTDNKRKAVTHNFRIGEKVLMRQKRVRKSMQHFSGRVLTIVAIKGSMITIENGDGSRTTRDACRFKRSKLPECVQGVVDAGLGDASGASVKPKSRVNAALGEAREPAELVANRQDDAVVGQAAAQVLERAQAEVAADGQAEQPIGQVNQRPVRNKNPIDRFEAGPASGKLNQRRN